MVRLQKVALLLLSVLVAASASSALGGAASSAPTSDIDPARSVALELADHGPVTLDLVPNALLSSGVGARSLDADGATAAMDPVELRTYRGMVRDGGPAAPVLSGWTVRVHETDDGFAGLVWSDQGVTWALFPDAGATVAVATHRLEALEHLHIDDGGVEAPDLGPQAPQASLGIGTPLVVRLAVELDHGKWQRSGDTWAEDVLKILNLADGMFEQIDVRIEVVWLSAWTEPDPYPARRVCGGSEDKLSQFRNWWNDNRGEVVRDEAYLVGTLYGGPIGCAYLRQLGTGAAYAVSKTFTSYAGNQTLADMMSAVLVAHEMGHNFDGRHERSWGTGFGTGAAMVGFAGTIMTPSLTASAPRFSGADGSVNTLVLENAGPMRSYAASRLLADPAVG